MNEPDLRRCLGKWQKRLGLDHWHILMVIEPCEDETAYMEVQRSIDYQRAKIIVNPWMVGIGDPPTKDLLMDITDAHVEESLVHELLHICTRDLVTIVRHDLTGLLHRDVQRVMEDSMARADERCVDALAVALCRAFLMGVD